MWIRVTLAIFLGIMAEIEVRSAEEDDPCPRQESIRGILWVALGSDVVLDCGGDVIVNGVKITPKIQNTQIWKRQKDDWIIKETMQRFAEGGSTHLTKAIGLTTRGSLQEETGSTMDISQVSANRNSMVTNKPFTEKVFSRHDVAQSAPSTKAAVAKGTEEVLDAKLRADILFEQDEYDQEEVFRVTRSFRKEVRWVLNGRHVRAVGTLRRSHLNWRDAGNYTCYNGDRLVSTIKIGVAVPPYSPSVFCYRKSPTSEVHCEWTSKKPIVPPPQCSLLLSQGLSDPVVHIPCSFSQSRCWCAFQVEEGNRHLHEAKLCVTNAAGSATSPSISFSPQEIVKPDPPALVMVKAVAGKTHMLRVSWSYPSSWTGGFYVLHFLLRYRPRLSEQYQTVWIHTTEHEQLYWTIFDALPHTQYEVQLQAKEEFEGVWSDWTDSVFAVTWSAPETTSAPDSTTTPKAFEIFSEDPGTSTIGDRVVMVPDADAVWLDMLWTSCWGSLSLLAFTALMACLLRAQMCFRCPVGKSLGFLVSSSSCAVEAIDLSPQTLPAQEEGIHLHNKGYFLTPGSESAPETTDASSV